MCDHSPHCPPAESPRACTAHVAVAHPEQGWCLLCNGVVFFDDGGALLPDGSEFGPRRPAHTAA